MAKVEMDLAELDLLRKSKDELEQELKQEKKVSESLRVTMEEVKGNKKVIERVKTVIEGSIPVEAESIIHNVLMRHSHVFNRDSFRASMQDIPSQLATALSVELKNKAKSSREETQVTNFVNVETLKEELRNELDAETLATIAELRANARIADQKYADLQAIQSKAVDKLNKTHKQSVEDLTEGFNEVAVATAKDHFEKVKYYDEKIEELNQTIEDLRANRETITKEEELNATIKSLQDALKQEQSRTIWQRIFGTGNYNPGIDYNGYTKSI